MARPALFFRRLLPCIVDYLSFLRLRTLASDRWTLYQQRWPVRGASNLVNIFEYARNWSQKVPWGQPQNWANRLRRPRTPVEFHRNSEQDELILTDILAMCLAPENHAKFNFRVRWFAEIARYALGYVTQEEEDEYERSRQFVATRVAWRQNDYGKIATGLNYMLRHDRSLDRLMDSRAMIELMPLITEGTARMPSPFRIYPNAFFAILHSDEKQRFHLVIRLDKNVWHNTGNQYDMPFSMRLGVNQGHTGLMHNISPEKLNHRLTSIEARCLGHVFHVTRRENWASIERYGLMRDPQSWNRRNRGEGRDYVHFMYSNPQTSLYIPLGPGTVVATRVAWRQNDYGKIATGLNYMLRHDRSLDRLMDSRAMIELMPLITEGTARMPSPFRIYPNAFFAILHSDEKQRFHLVIRLDKNVWHNTGNQYDMPFSMRLGVNQGHTGLMHNISPEKLNHRLTSIEARCLGHVFHVTRRENWASIERYGLMRDPQSWNRRNRGEGRDYVHFMYSNPQTSLYIPLGPGTVVPRDYGQPLYVKLNVILWLRAGRPLYFSNNGVVLAHCDVEPTYLDISVDEPQPQDAPEPAKELRNPKSAEEMMELINSEKVQQERVRGLFARLSIDKPYARELLRRIHAEEPETKQVKRHMLLWLDNLDLGAIARFVQYENHPEREYNRSRLRSRQVMSEGHYLQGWSLITPKEIDDRDPWSILGYSTPKLIVDGDGVTSRSLFMVHPLVLSKDQAKLVKADEEVIRFDHIWTDITSKSSTARTSGEPQQDEEDDSAHVAEREMTWFIQNVSNLVLNPWMVYDIGMVSLHDRIGTRVLQSTGEDVILVRDWDRLTRHQREYFCRGTSCYVQVFMEQRKTPRRMHQVLNPEFLSGWSWHKLDTNSFSSSVLGRMDAAGLKF